jgi:hypothetical protein
MRKEGENPADFALWSTITCEENGDLIAHLAVGDRGNSSGRPAGRDVIGRTVPGVTDFDCTRFTCRGNLRANSTCRLRLRRPPAESRLSPSNDADNARTALPGQYRLHWRWRRLYVARFVRPRAIIKGTLRSGCRVARSAAGIRAARDRSRRSRRDLGIAVGLRGWRHYRRRVMIVIWQGFACLRPAALAGCTAGSHSTCPPT